MFKACEYEILLTALVNWSTLNYFAEPATTKCKLVAVLQLSLTLMIGQARTNSYQNLSQFKVIKS